MGPRERGGGESSLRRDVHRAAAARVVRAVYGGVVQATLLSVSWTWCQRPWHTVPRSVGLGQGDCVGFDDLCILEPPV